MNFVIDLEHTSLVITKRLTCSSEKLKKKTNFLISGSLEGTVVSSTKTLAADHSSPVGCKVKPPWIELVDPAQPTDTQLD